MQYRTFKYNQVIDMDGVSLGGGVLSFFSSYVGSGPASTVHPKIISGISSAPKNYLKFYQPKKNDPSLRLFENIRVPPGGVRNVKAEKRLSVVHYFIETRC